MTTNRPNIGFLLATILLVSPSGMLARASDHVDAPAIMEDGRNDINDIYAFLSPANSNNTVLAMTVNPLAGILSPSTFNPRTSYEFNIDKNNDTVPDFAIIVRFSPLLPSGSQNVFFKYRTKNGDVDAGWGKVGTDIALRGGGIARAETFDDPFFFDFNGFNDGFNFTGDDFFAGFNVSGIVIELPNQRIGNKDSVGFWGRTRLSGIQQDRAGRPAISTALISSSEDKDLFNQTVPSTDFANFSETVQATIESLSGDEGYAEAVTAILLPDVLTIDRSQPTNFLNGRGLADDVIDVELDVLSMGGVVTDMVDENDLPFLNVFPYLAPPHDN